MNKEKLELKKLKVEKGYKVVNWTPIILTILIGVMLFFGLFFVLTTWLVNAAVTEITQAAGVVGESMTSAIANNPEIAFALNKDLSDNVMYLALASQMRGEGDVQGSFNGYFTTREERSLEKIDLRCIDKYNYVMFKNPGLVRNKSRSSEYPALTKYREELEDDGCYIYGTGDDLFYYKCPLRNCNQRVVKRIVPDKFIPDKVNINRIQVSAGGD